MKNMKTIILCVVLFFMCGCGSKRVSPSKIVESFMDSIKTGDIVNAYTYSTMNYDKSVINENNSDGLDAEKFSLLFTKMKEIEYKVNSETITDNSAKVNLTIKTYNFGDAMTKAIADYFKEAFVLSFAGASEEELSNLMVEKMEYQIENAEKNYEKTIDVDLVLEDDKWLIKDDNSLIIKNILGGMIEKLENLSSNFGDNETEKEALVKVEDIELVGLKVNKPNSIGVVYMETKFKNNSKYPLTSIQYTYVVNDSKTYLMSYDTLLPGETSVIVDGFGPKSQNINDAVLIEVSYTYIDENKEKINVDYDCKLESYSIW